MSTPATLCVGQSSPESLLSRWLKPFLRPASRRNETRLSLPRGGVRRLAFAPGGSILCEGGCVWITRDGGGEDIVLHAGESHQFPRETSVLIEALEPAKLDFTRPAAR